MKSVRCSEFIGDFQAPELFIDPLHGPGISTLRGIGMDDPDLRKSMHEIVGERRPNGDISFCDTDKIMGFDTLLDRFTDVTGGLSPGIANIEAIDVSASASVSVIAQRVDETTRRLARFFESTGVHPHTPLTAEASTPEQNGASTKPAWGGETDKLEATIRLPYEGAQGKSLLHELGHSTMGLVGFRRSSMTQIDPVNIDNFQTYNTYALASQGLIYRVGGEDNGIILEEGVAEGIGALANEKLRITQPLTPNENIPPELRKYIIDGRFSGSAPAALSLELIAQELGLPMERYLKMLADYANVGVHALDAREEVAETIYRGTRGKLTLADIEGLPYPSTKPASLAFLWGVESALDVPHHTRYSQYFL